MIVLVTWFSSASGGGERSTIDLCNRLSTSPRCESVILLYAYSNSSSRLLAEEHLDTRVSRYLVSTPLLLWRFLAFFYVAYICMVCRPSLVQVSFRATLAESLAAKLFQCPVIACLRIIPFHRKQLRQYCLVDHIACISGAVHERLRRLGWKKEATVIYNGVDVGCFIGADDTVQLDSSAFYILGRLVNWKRPDWFIQAAAILHVRHPTAQFHIFGEGPMRGMLEHLVNRYGLSSVVHIRGWADPTDSSVRRCGIFVLPSFEEPFGRSLLEAVLQGKVVVASGSGAVPELLGPHELLFPRDDLDQLVTMMDKATSDFNTYRAQARQMRHSFAERFNLDRLAEDYIALYDHVVKAASS